MGSVRIGSALALFATAVLSTGCGREEKPEQSTFYERRIAPVLEGSCARSPTQSRCHVSVDDRGNALGNLDLSSFSALDQRRDLLVEYGPYGVPGLLLKVLPAYDLRLTYWDGSEPQIITTDVAHVGGSLLDFTSPSFTQLETWIRNGAAENNAPPAQTQVELLPCSTTLGTDALFDPNLEPTTPDFESFADVNRTLSSSCAAGNCHGSPINSLYLTCGETPEQIRWNYFAVSDYVTADADSSPLLRQPLASEQGGNFHEGGDLFFTTDDADYQALKRWIEAKGGPSNIPDDPGFAFFERRVQPMLVKRGCMMLGCHSATMFHDFRLRGSSGGHFGLPVSRTNYELALEQVALESPDPNTSRLLRKNLPPAPLGPGILHRGGPLFASGGDPAACDMEAARTGPINDQSPYCVIAAWIELERAERMQGVLPLTSVVYVKRPPAPAPDSFQDFAAYASGAEVLRAPLTRAEDGSLTLGTAESLSALCGLDPSVTDARRPQVSWDGHRIAFAARVAADAPLRIYVIDGDSCSVEPNIDAPPVNEASEPLPTNGELIHNFDPVFAPDGRIVFASTRGNVMNTAAFSYQGPQRTPADPSRLNANLYILEGNTIRQLTFLLNQELNPSFMNDGRLIFTAEKRAPGFYQLAGRRINLDGGDYHPLFGQRSTIGFNQFTEVVELADETLAAIVSDKGVLHGAGTLMIINRSIGIDQASDNPEDYTQDPSAIDALNPAFYQHSMRIIDPAATGKLNGTTGAYRSPSPLPDGRLLASYAANVTDLTNFSGNFDIVVVDPLTGERTPLISDAQDLLWPVAVYGRFQRSIFTSRLHEVNGATKVFADERRDRSEIMFLDMPLVLSLLFQNTRTGRHIPASPLPVQLWEHLPPEAGVTSFEQGGAHVVEDAFGRVYVRRQLLGSPQLYPDGSARVRIRGGIPLLLSANIQLTGDAAPVNHFVREALQFYPGEFARQSFPRGLFNGICGGCHGSVSGIETQVAANPDVLTSASDVVARDQLPTDLREPQGAPVGPN